MSFFFFFFAHGMTLVKELIGDVVNCTWKQNGYARKFGAYSIWGMQEDDGENFRERNKRG